MKNIDFIIRGAVIGLLIWLMHFIAYLLGYPIEISIRNTTINGAQALCYGLVLMPLISSLFGLMIVYSFKPFERFKNLK